MSISFGSLFRPPDWLNYYNMSVCNKSVPSPPPLLALDCYYNISFMQNDLRVTFSWAKCLLYAMLDRKDLSAYRIICITLEDIKFKAAYQIYKCKKGIFYKKGLFVNEYRRTWITLFTISLNLIWMLSNMKAEWM